MLDADAAVSRRVRFDFDDVPDVAGDAGDNLVKLFLGFRGKDGRTTLEGNFDVAYGLILIEPINLGADLSYTTGCGLRYGAGLLSLGTGGGGCRVGCVCCALRLMDSSLSAGVNVLDVACFLGGYLVEC